MIKKMLLDFLGIIDRNRGKSIGALLGFIIGVMVLTIGFFKTLFIIICTVIGYTLGGKSYNKVKIKDWLERILPPGGIG